MSRELPVLPSRDNAATHCVLVDGDARYLPDHIRQCGCAEHDGVCQACGFKITVGPSGTEYGHARAVNRDHNADDRRDCRHRPASCDPNGPQALANRGRNERGESV